MIREEEPCPVSPRMPDRYPFSGDGGDHRRCLVDCGRGRAPRSDAANHLQQRHEDPAPLREQGLDPEELAGLAKAADQIATALAGLPEDLQHLISGACLLP